MRYLQFSLSILALSALHLSASAQDRPDRGRRDEFERRIFTSADKHFTNLDTDESGTLTFTEFQQGHRGGPR